MTKFVGKGLVVGDRVRVKNINPDYNTGTVKGEDLGFIAIELDKMPKNIEPNDCNGLVPNGRGWWAKIEELG